MGYTATSPKVCVATTNFDPVEEEHVEINDHEILISPCYCILFQPVACGTPYHMSIVFRMSSLCPNTAVWNAKHRQHRQHRTLVDTDNRDGIARKLISGTEAIHKMPTVVMQLPGKRVWIATQGEV